MLVSVIVPIFNEEDALSDFHARMTDALDGAGFEFEVIFVNDGSTDGSGRKLAALAGRDPRFKVIELRRNYGQTAAMVAGFDFAAGRIIVPMDGDLQNDPKDIPRLVAKLEEGFDVCSGWRRDRKDGWLRSLLSRVANRVISAATGVRLHDYGCTLKAYRREVITGIRLYGEMHRFIPIHARWQGARITEIPVDHHPRTTGSSKYGMERIFKVFLDLLLLVVYSTLANKPLYLFGGFGLMNVLCSFAGFALMIYFKFWGGKSFVETPLPQLVILFFLVGVISILLGFLAEILIRTYHESQGKPIYDIEQTRNIDPPG